MNRVIIQVSFETNTISMIENILSRHYARTWLLKQISCSVLLVVVMVTPVLGAPDVDLHWLWDDRCESCHGHAGDFARKFLSITAHGELQGRHHVHNLRQFLDNHHLQGKDVAAVYSMLLSQANKQARFRKECSSCHESAAEFVRSSLLLRDGVLFSQRTGRSVASSLRQHRKLTPDDMEFFTSLLTRVAKEVYRP